MLTSDVGSLQNILLSVYRPLAVPDLS